jgi:chromosome segregation ATPase
MKKFYYIFPVCLLITFVTLYSRFSAASYAVEAEKAQRVADAKMAQEKTKAEAEERSREDSQKRAAERLAEERTKEAEKAAKWDAESKRIAAETEKYNSQLASYNSEISSMQKQIEDLRATKETRTRELLDDEMQVELASVGKHNAEMEIQRMTEMLMRRVSKSSLVKQ